jgi:hypothetical protein
LVQREDHRVEAGRCDARILKSDRHDFASLDRLGVITAQAGKFEEAARLLGRAAEASGCFPGNMR